MKIGWHISLSIFRNTSVQNDTATEAYFPTYNSPYHSHQVKDFLHMELFYILQINLLMLIVLPNAPYFHFFKNIIYIF